MTDMTSLERQTYDHVKTIDVFSWHTLVDELGISRNAALNYIRRWEVNGLIRCVRQEGNSRFFLVDGKTLATPVIKEPAQSAEGNMWRSMRMLGQFTPLDLAAHSSAGGIDVSVEKAASYCRLLMDGGYLRCRRKAVPGRHAALYQLIHETGPKAPCKRRVTGLWDPNTSAFTPKSLEGRP